LSDLSTVTPLSAGELTQLLERNLPQIDRRGEVVEEIGRDFLRMRLPVLDTYLSRDLPPGSGQAVVSGPVMIGAAETAMYACVHAFYGAEVSAVLVSLNVSFLRIAGTGDITVVARILRRGKSLAFLEAHLHAGEVAEPCAHATATYSVRSIDT
jgi:acyl-coenzyme A thioesterase PaaI-like protein